MYLLSTNMATTFSGNSSLSVVVGFCNSGGACRFRFNFQLPDSRAMDLLQLSKPLPGHDLSHWCLTQAPAPAFFFLTSSCQTSDRCVYYSISKPLPGQGVRHGCLTLVPVSPSGTQWIKMRPRAEVCRSHVNAQTGNASS